MRYLRSIRFVRAVLLPAISLVILLSVLGGCTTVGDIPVELAGEDIVYISPANGDGVQDEARFPLSLVPLERTVITQAVVTVTDANGTVVRRREERAPEAGFFERQEGLDPGDTVLWDGRNNSGAFVPDGRYTLVVEATDNRENTGTGPAVTIVVDNTPPSVELSAPFLLFTPNGDDRLDVLAVYQRNSTLEDAWTGRMIHADGDSVREFTWNGGARDFVWDGTSDSGVDAPEGYYTYVVESTDRAGNTGRFELSGIELSRDPGPISISLSRRTFSPNGDGRADTVALYPLVRETEGFEQWQIRISSSDGDVVRTYSGTGLPDTLTFDGRDQEGGLVPDGEFVVSFRADYAGGRQVETASPVLKIDTQPPQATVRLSSAAASPDGDGVNDTVLIRQSSSNETTWVGRFSNAAGTHVRSLTWNGRVTDFEWDGTDQSGVRLPDGVYTYRLFSVDEGDNEAVPSVVQIRLDTTEPEVSVDTYPARFSPDGDGVDDLLRIAITAADAGPLEGWSATMLDPTGQPFVSWSGAGTPPESLYWDGLSENGEVVQSAEVYELDVDVRDVAGNVGAARVDVRIGILVEREGERLRIRISSIYFVPFTSDYVNLDDPERAARNLETLDNLATVLSEYPEYKITIEGHAVSLLWEDPDEARREQREVLVPLSLARAEVIKAALVERGVDPDRMTTVGYGGARPVVPHWDEQNRWKNRRVEFVLEKEE